MACNPSTVALGIEFNVLEAVSARIERARNGAALTKGAQWAGKVSLGAMRLLAQISSFTVEFWSPIANWDPVCRPELFGISLTFHAAKQVGYP
jgi:hypothetical protein